MQAMNRHADVAHPTEALGMLTMVCLHGPQAEVASQENAMLKTLLKCLTPCREGVKKQPALACLAFMKNSLAAAPNAVQTSQPTSQGTSASSIVALPMGPSSIGANALNDTSRPASDSAGMGSSFNVSQA